MKISNFLAKYVILAAILNFRTLAVSNVIGGQIFWQIRVLRQIWPWKQPVLFQICEKSSDMPNPSNACQILPWVIRSKKYKTKQNKTKKKKKTITWNLYYASFSR